MKSFIAALLVLAPMSASAEENFRATNTYVTESKAWPIDQATGYWMVAFNGVSQVDKGPVDTTRVECHGAGYWGPDGLDGKGICIHGEGDDTFIVRFDSRPDGNTWKVLSGTGKCQNLSGFGTAVTEAIPGNRRISKLVGHVALGD